MYGKDFDILKDILKTKPKRLIYFPARRYLQVDWRNEEVMREFLKNNKDRILKSFYSSTLLSADITTNGFRSLALLFHEVEFYIKRGVKVEEYLGDLNLRWRTHLRGWKIEEGRDIYGNFKIAFKDVSKSNIRLVRVNDEILELDNPPRMNVLGVFTGNFGGKHIKRIIERFRVMEGKAFKQGDEDKGFLKLGDYIIKVLENSIIVVHLKRATYRVVFEILRYGNPRIRNMVIPVKLKLEDNLKLRLREFGFTFYGDTLRSIPELPVGFQPETLNEIKKELSGIEENEIFVKKLAKFISERSAVLDVDKLLFDLFLCKNPFQDPDGNIIILRWREEEIRKHFGEIVF